METLKTISLYIALILAIYFGFLKVYEAGYDNGQKKAKINADIGSLLFQRAILQAKGNAESYEWLDSVYKFKRDSLYAKIKIKDK